MPPSRGGFINGGGDPLQAPNAPTINQVTNGIGSLDVSFTAPVNTGSSFISSYTFTAVNETTQASTGAVATVSPATISLPVSGTYKVRVSATSIYGSGRESEYDTNNSVFASASVWGWGDNTAGSVGDNTVVSRSSPVQVGALTTWVFVSAGSRRVHAIKSDGTLWGWGSSSSSGGTIGDNANVPRSSPVQVGVATTWAYVAGGVSATAAVQSDGTLWTWGAQDSGQLGNGVESPISKLSPIQIGALTNWSTVSVGDAFCAAVKTDGTLWTWGNGTSGRLGQNSIVSRSSPVQVGSDTVWKQASAGAAHAMAIRVDGTLWAWGSNNNSALGDGTTANRSSPVQIGALMNWRSVSAGLAANLADKNDGTLWAWGSNNDGQLGNSLVADVNSPIQVGALTDWFRPKMGADVAAALRANGALWAWGVNSSGQLGDGTVISRSSPVQIGALTDWTQVSVGNTGSSNTDASVAALYGVT